MKIIQITPRYFPYFGGIERVVKSISEKLIEYNNDVIIYTTDPSFKLNKLETINGVVIKRYGVFAPKGTNYLPSHNFIKDLIKEDADILHINQIYNITSLIGYVRYKLRRDLKIVASPYYHGYEGGLLARLLTSPFLPTSKMILKNVDGIIVNSNAEKQIIEQVFNSSSKTYNIYDGVNIEDIIHAKKYEFHDQNKRLLCLGRLEPYKNVHVVITAMKMLPKEYHLYIIGDGSFKNVLKQITIQYNLTDRVHFLGYINENSLNRWLKSVDCTVHLSNLETFGMTCLESLAAGTPVIANDDGFGLKETIDLFPDAIREYKVGRQPLNELVKIIRETVELKPITVDLTEFSWDSITNKLYTTYKSVIKK